MSTETNLISEQNLGAYVQGCEQVAVTLDDTVNNILETGKKPTILIPSRGAVPIYLIAATMLGDLDSNHILLDRDRTRYYPNKIFEYLSAGRLTQNGPTNQQVEVVLYPFTADVSSEKDEEKLARKLRYSASRAFLDLVSGDRGSLDLQWYFHLMSQMQSSAYTNKSPDVRGFMFDETELLDPQGIVESLQSIKPSPDREIILIDTVISGRASSHILESFNQLGQPATPILVVDDINGQNRFQSRFRSVIRKNMKVDYLPNSSTEQAFTYFPLITEDQGAALLGVSAVNFDNFIEEGYFHQVDPNFSPDFLPQSCVWALPPGKNRAAYGKAFHTFLELCMKKARGEDLGDTSNYERSLRGMILGHGAVDFAELRMLAKVGKGVSGRESSSHIVSVTLPDKEAQNWIRDFASNSHANAA